MQTIYKNELTSTPFNKTLAQARCEIYSLLSLLKDMERRDDYLDTEWVKEDFCYGCSSIEDALKKLVEIKDLFFVIETSFAKKEECMQKDRLDVAKAWVDTTRLNLSKIRLYLLYAKNEVHLARGWISDVKGTLETKPKFKTAREKNNIGLIKKALEECVEYTSREIGAFEEKAQKQEQAVSLFRQQLNKIAKQGGQKA